MEKLTKREIFGYFDGWYAYKLLWPSIIATFFLSGKDIIYQPRANMKEFFNDRPWLEMNPALYEDYIREDFRLKNEEISKKIREVVEIDSGILRKRMFEKKIL